MPSKSRLKPYDAIPFTNRKGQVINPGDPILIVTVCTGHASAVTGRYLGARSGPGWNGTTIQNVVVEKNLVEKRQVQRTDETKERNWNDDERILGVKAPRYPWRDHSITDFNEREKKYKLDLEQYEKDQRIYQNAVERTFKWIEVPYTKNTTLQRNLIFPLNISGLDLMGVI